MIGSFECQAGQTGATQAHKLRALFSPDFDAEFVGRDAYRELVDGLDVAGQLAGRAPLNQSLYLWAKVVLPNYVLAFLGDLMEMAHSIEQPTAPTATRDIPSWVVGLRRFRNLHRSHRPMRVVKSWVYPRPKPAVVASALRTKSSLAFGTTWTHW